VALSGSPMSLVVNKMLMIRLVNRVRLDWLPTCSSSDRLIGRPMETVSNLAFGPAAQHAADPASLGSKAPDGTVQPVFARVVQEILIRTAKEKDVETRPALEAKGKSGAKISATPTTPGNAAAPAESPSAGVSLPSLGLTPILAALPPSKQPGSDPAVTDETSASTTASSTAAASTSSSQTVASVDLSTNLTGSKKSDVVLQLTGEPSSTSQGEPISSVLRQIEQLQSEAAQVPPQIGSSTTRAQLSLATTKATLSLTAFLATSSAVIPLPTPAAKASQTASPELGSSAPAQSPSTASPNHSGSQNSSSNRGMQSAADTLVPPESASSRETTIFAETLAAASATKPDVALNLVNPPAAVSIEPAQAIDRSTSPAPTPGDASLTPALPTFHNLDAAVSRFVSNAQLIEAAGHSEMHIAMRTDKLGAIELHARVAGDEIGAAITVEKRDAHAALAIELPALQQALSDKQLRVDQVALVHGSLSSMTGDSGAHAQAHQGDRGHARYPAAQLFAAEFGGMILSSQLWAEHGAIFDSRGRLSVRA
jgi:hypothetical protein